MSDSQEDELKRLDNIKASLDLVNEYLEDPNDLGPVLPSVGGFINWLVAKSKQSKEDK